MKLEGNTFVVTGGAGGLGAAASVYFHHAGANVVVLDMSESLGAEMEKNLGSRCLFVKTDITNEESVNDALDLAESSFGSIQGVVNCAGIAASQRVLSKKGDIHSLSAFDRVLKVNVTGTFNVVRLAVARMAQNEVTSKDDSRGVIINIASVAAFEGQIGQAAYSASKGAVVGMTLPLARELGSLGIRVATIAPGVIRTPMLAALPEKVQDSLSSQTVFPKRLGKPEEFAQLCAHIVENEYINGETIRLDAGIRMAAM